MDIAKHEIALIEERINQATQQQMQELNDLQLAFMGGGVGEVIIA